MIGRSVAWLSLGAGAGRGGAAGAVQGQRGLAAGPACAWRGGEGRPGPGAWARPGVLEGDRAEDEAGQACWDQLAKMLPWPATRVRNMHGAVSPLKAECCRKWNVGFEHRVNFAHV